MPSTILLVEDEMPMAAMVQAALASDDYAVVHAGTAAEAWGLLETLRPALAILDVGLPDESGLSLCRRIRAHPSLGPTPIIMLTARDKFKDKVIGFEAGADYYLIKPFQIQELTLWVRALLSRLKYSEQDGGVLRLRDFVIDPQTRRVQAGSQVVSDLTRKEFDLLYCLIQQTPKVLSTEEILSVLWTKALRDDTVEVHIKNIRAKLGPAGARVVTTPGVGYHFV